jgi:hypothetical protein
VPNGAYWHWAYGAEGNIWSSREGKTGVYGKFYIDEPRRANQIAKTELDGREEKFNKTSVENFKTTVVSFESQNSTKYYLKILVPTSLLRETHAIYCESQMIQTNTPKG